jgi:dihydrolipoamide dehydrogenase
LVIGAGYIGLELGSVWKRFGSNVTVVEYADLIVPSLDIEIGKKFHQILKNQGIEFKLGYKLLSAEYKNGKVLVEIENKNSKESEKLEADILLLAVGRIPYSSNLGLENIGIELDSRMRIPVNQTYQTKIENIYAVGDVIRWTYVST